MINHSHFNSKSSRFILKKKKNWNNEYFIGKLVLRKLIDISLQIYR